MTLKVGDDQSRAWSAFETVVSPGFDVGAHLHNHAEEVFYILDGELDLLAFEPHRADRRLARLGIGPRAAGHARRARRGDVRPARCPHAFANPGRGPARMLFLVSPPGHEHYLAEMGELIGHGGPPSPSAIAELRARWDIQQLTPMVTGRPRG
jgi:oxalate decarboxylase/phosphoglucose isomerase-like protein (cupin superfamily)